MTLVLKPHYTLTRHTWHRLQEMGLTRADVLQIIEDPEITYDTSSHGTTEPRKIAARGPYAVVYNTYTNAVVTVLHRTTDQYVRPEAERFQWASDPQRVLTSLLARLVRSFRDPMDAVTVGSKVLSYFGIPSDVITVLAGGPLLYPRPRPVLIVHGNLVDIPLSQPLPDDFWLGETVNFGGMTYTYQPAITPEIDWSNTPNEQVSYLQEEILKDLKEEA